MSAPSPLLLALLALPAAAQPAGSVEPADPPPRHRDVRNWEVVYDEGYALSVLGEIFAIGGSSAHRWWSPATA